MEVLRLPNLASGLVLIPQTSKKPNIEGGGTKQ